MSTERSVEERDDLRCQRDLLVRYIAEWRVCRKSVLTDPGLHLKACVDVEKANAAINAHPVLKQMIDEHEQIYRSYKASPKPGVAAAEAAAKEVQGE